MISDDPYFKVCLARDERDLLAAQRLRYSVFVDELGGDGALVDHDQRFERDEPALADAAVRLHTAGLLPLPDGDDRIARVVGTAGRPGDPAADGWAKMAYRRGDVRDPDTLAAAFRGAEVVVHLAFLVMGTASPATTATAQIREQLRERFAHRRRLIARRKSIAFQCLCCAASPAQKRQRGSRP